MGEDGIDLEAVLDQLRVELSAMRTKASAEDLRFTLETVDVELKVAVTRERTVGAKAKFWVLDANGASKQAHQSSHTIRLSMRPASDVNLDG